MEKILMKFKDDLHGYEFFANVSLVYVDEFDNKS